MTARPLVFPLLALALCAPFAASAQAPLTAKTNSMVGVVTDGSSVPIPGVEIALMNRGQMMKQVVSSADGRFTFGELPVGVVLIRLRRLGYEARDVEFQNDDTTPSPLQIALKPVPAALEEVLVSGTDARLREFNDHRKQRGSFGKFFDQSEIRKKGVTNTSDLFRSVPGISIKAHNTGNTLRIRGCQPMIWVDGQRVPGAELDEIASPSDIAGIELYLSMAGTPAQYMERTNRACGTVLVWTRNR